MNNDQLLMQRFSFKKPPFTASIEQPFLNDERLIAVKGLNRFLQDRGFAVITGNPGTGKTFLIKHLCNGLSSNENTVVYIPFATLTPPDMLKLICAKLEIFSNRSQSKMLSDIQNHISDSQAVNAVFILDEIQKISHETLEIIRLMTNFNFEEKSLFSIIMIGNNEFLQALRLAINKPLKQRITYYSNLKEFSRTDTHLYILHHLKQAGVHHEIISLEASSLIYDCTFGVPRLINTLVKATLEFAAEKQSNIVELSHINAVREYTLLNEKEIFA